MADMPGDGTRMVCVANAQILERGRVQERRVLGELRAGETIQACGPPFDECDLFLVPIYHQVPNSVVELQFMSPAGDQPQSLPRASYAPGGNAPTQASGMPGLPGAGTRMQCLANCPVYEKGKVHERRPLGEIQAGDSIVASGSPYDESGLFVIPILPNGVVELQYMGPGSDAPPAVQSPPIRNSYAPQGTAPGPAGNAPGMPGAGTRMQCLANCPVYEKGKVHERRPLGEIRAGDFVVASGSPFEESGAFVIPINPNGVVELQFMGPPGDEPPAPTQSSASNNKLALPAPSGGAGRQSYAGQGGSPNTAPNAPGMPGAGTRMQCLANCPVYEKGKVNQRKPLGEMKAGDFVVASGSPFEESGVFVIPINPNGVVELQYMGPAGDEPAPQPPIRNSYAPQGTAPGPAANAPGMPGAGTRMQCLANCPVYEKGKVHLRKPLGEIKAGDFVVASASPFEESGAFVIPINPNGVVELQFMGPPGDEPAQSPPAPIRNSYVPQGAPPDPAANAPGMPGAGTRMQCLGNCPVYEKGKVHERRPLGEIKAGEFVVASGSPFEESGAFVIPINPNGVVELQFMGPPGDEPPAPTQSSASNNKLALPAPSGGGGRQSYAGRGGSPNTAPNAPGMPGAGTRMQCLASCPVYEKGKVHLRKPLGEIKAGDFVVASGSPFEESGAFVIPINPNGVVELQFMGPPGDEPVQAPPIRNSYAPQGAPPDSAANAPGMPGAGTRMQCLANCPVYEKGKVHERRPLGEIRAGDFVVANGSPFEESGAFVIPINPNGVVELQYMGPPGDEPPVPPMRASYAPPGASPNAGSASPGMPSAGTRMQCIGNCAVYERGKVNERRPLGEIRAGEFVVASGSPFEESGLFVIPINPNGVVELQFMGPPGDEPTQQSTKSSTFVESTGSNALALPSSSGALSRQSYMPQGASPDAALNMPGMPGAGTRMQCIANCPVFEQGRVHERRPLGEIRAGECIVANGSPFEEAGSVVIPILPNGVVELQYVGPPGDEPKSSLMRQSYMPQGASPDAALNMPGMPGAGTRMQCIASCPVYDKGRVHERRPLGEIKAGEFIVANGSPFEESGCVVIPIVPNGVVELHNVGPASDEPSLLALPSPSIGRNSYIQQGGPAVDNGGMPGAGTRMMCIANCPVYESGKVQERRPIGEINAGDYVVADGSPCEDSGLFVIPILPNGVVELQYFGPPSDTPPQQDTGSPGQLAHENLRAAGGTLGMPGLASPPMIRITPPAQQAPNQGAGMVGMPSLNSVAPSMLPSEGSRMICLENSDVFEPGGVGTRKVIGQVYNGQVVTAKGSPMEEYGMTLIPIYPDGIVELFHFGPEGAEPPTDPRVAAGMPSDGAHMICLEDSEVYAQGKVKQREILGHVKAGEIVVAKGAPIEENGMTLVPLYPEGVVEIFHFAPSGVAPGVVNLPPSQPVGAVDLPSAGVHMLCLQDSEVYEPGQVGRKVLGYVKSGEVVVAAGSPVEEFGMTLIPIQPFGLVELFHFGPTSAHPLPAESPLHLKAVSDGTHMSCLENSNVYEVGKVGENKILGHVKVGEIVVAKGPTVEEFGMTLVPLYPNGLVELFHFAPESAQAPINPVQMSASGMPENGTHMVCLQDCSVYFSGQKEKVVGHVKAGEVVVAKGAPTNDDGRLVLPLWPYGDMVDLQFFGPAAVPAPLAGGQPGSTATASLPAPQSGPLALPSDGSIMVCLHHCEIYDQKKLTQRKIVGQVKGGSLAIAAGSPFEENQCLFVPISKPKKGVVELYHFRPGDHEVDGSSSEEEEEQDTKAKGFWKITLPKMNFFGTNTLKDVAEGDLLVCQAECEVYNCAVLKPWNKIGTISQGDFLIAAGVPEGTSKQQIVPVRPQAAHGSGYVEGRFLRKPTDEEKDALRNMQNPGQALPDDGAEMIALTTAEVLQRGFVEEHLVLGQVFEGQKVVAAGPPEEECGYVMVPIRGPPGAIGVVQLNLFRPPNALESDLIPLTRIPKAPPQRPMHPPVMESGERLVCQKSGFIYEPGKVDTHIAYGKLQEGQSVVLAGRPYEEYGYLMIAIRPWGVVESSCFEPLSRPSWAQERKSRRKQTDRRTYLFEYDSGQKKMTNHRWAKD